MTVLVLAVLVLLVAAAVIAYPLVFGALEGYLAADLPDEEYRESDALLEAMSELELSYGSGKLSEQDYQTEKRRLQSQYLRVADAPGRKSGEKSGSMGGGRPRTR